jgi:hypothetical protein
MIKELVTLIAKLTALTKSGFHGSVTIHFANGCPKKVKTELSEDL